MVGKLMRWRPGLLPDHSYANAWIMGAWLVALAAPLVEALWRAPGRVRIVLLVLAVSIFWEFVFARTLRRRIDPLCIVAALVFAILAPADAPLWHLAMGFSFAAVFAVHVFGGHGWSFLNLSVVAFAFLLFAFPSAALAAIAFPSWPSVLPGALLLILVGIVSVHVVTAVVLAFCFVSVIFTGGDGTVLALAPALAFPVVFLACEPVASPTLVRAQWAYGVIVGGLVSLLVVSGRPLTESVFSAILLGQLFAPLFEHAAVQWHVWRRENGHG